MAACLLNAIATQQSRTDIRAVSAGLHAVAGQPASSGAQHAMERRGLSLADHRSQPLTDRLLHDVSIVIGLTSGHIASLQTKYPTLQIQSFSPSISDPYGMDDRAYEHTAAEIERQLQTLISSL